CCLFFFSSRRRHTRFSRDWSSDVCSSDLSWEKGGKQSKLSFDHRRPTASPTGTSGTPPHRPPNSTRQYCRRSLRTQHRPTKLGRSEERRVGKDCSARWAASAHGNKPSARQ